MPIKPRETETADGDDETRVLFKGVSVFDRSQVAPVDRMSQAPLEPPSEPLTGDSHAHLLEPMRAFAQSVGFTVSFELIPGATGGWCDQKARRIVVDAGQPANAQLRILIRWRRSAFSALSALFRDAVELEYLEANPAHRLRVRPNDPRLDPVKETPARRAVSPEEIHAFIEHVRPGYRAVCWTPALTSARPAELFAMRRQDIDRRRQMIFVAETLTRYGEHMKGLKRTHHIAAREQRGRWLLFPAILYELLDERPTHVSGLLFPSPRGRPWNVRNFYRSIWEPARKKAGVSFTLYDLRHTFSSRLLAAGIPLVEVAAWMGHSLRAGGAEVDNTTSRVYAHATGEWRDVALAELSALVTGEERTRQSARGGGRA